MAQKVAAATGAWSAAATWDSVTNTPTLHASTNITISTSNLFTATFTAPNTTNACTGVLLFIPAVGSGGTVTVTLQESTVDTAAARSIAVTSLVAATWVYFRFATPYVFTTTGAGAYRFKIVNAGATGTTSAAADSGGANIAYLATDDRTGAPGTTDDVWIVGQNQATAITVTVDSSQTIGSKTDTVVAVQRTLGNAISINNLGVLAWDTVADATLTCGGNIICNNNSGELQIGTVASPMPSARIAKLRFDMAADGNHGLRVFDTGKLTLQGRTLADYSTKYASGLGTAASPLVVSEAVDWSVGDYIVIGATSNNATNYNENEFRYIITKNSATSYVVSSTAGGAEAALTHTHTTDAWVLNLQRNVIIDSTNSSRNFYVNIGCTTAGNVDIDWTFFDVIGINVTGKEGIVLRPVASTSPDAQIDYSVINRFGNAGMFFFSATVARTYSNVILTNQVGTQSALMVNSGARDKTFNDFFFLTVKRSGIFASANSATNTYNRCIAIGCNIDNDSAHSGFSLTTTNKNTFNDCEVHACRRRGVLLSGTNDAIFNNLLAGTKGVNQTTDVESGVSFYNKVVFINSNFGSATLMASYLLMLAGSEVAFHTLNDTANNHTWYTNAGIARTTGAGLVDTTNKTAGNLTVRIAPEDTTFGFVWEFLVGIKASTAASIFGFAQKNVAFGISVCTVELFLPGSTVADATATLDNTTGAWQVFNLAASYTGLVAGFATIRITAKTATAAAYVYFSDFYNGTNVLTGLQAWYNGKPSPVFTDLLGDPASVWAILTSTLTTVGTVGYQVTNDLNDLQTALQAVDDLVDDLEGRLTAGRATNLDNLDATISSRLASASYTAPPSAASIVSTLLAALIETGLTFKNAMRTIAASTSGKLSGAATAQVKIRNAVADDKDRITADVDADGNRTNVTYDFTD